jgi:hypothetical protein
MKEKRFFSKIARMQTRSQTRKMAAKLAAATKVDNTVQVSGSFTEQIDLFEQPQEQEVAAVQEQNQKTDCNVKDIEQQEYESTTDDGCEDDEDGSKNEEEMESLLKKAEESLRANQSAKK